MNEALPTTRDRLILAGATLFRERGFHGTSVADILARAQAPKGSLYHHFPDGKADLALAAAHATSLLVLDIVARAYEPAASFREGTARMCEKFARLFEREPDWRGCPVQALLDGPLGVTGADGHAILLDWIAATELQARRLGIARAEPEARRVWTFLIGAWTLARAAGTPGPLRDMPKLLG